MFATGAVTLLQLLELVPGVTTFTTGNIASPQFAAYAGNPGRVRIFLDGMEIDNLDPRAGGALDLAELQLWSLEQVTIERGADELRIYCRTWSVQRTTTSTRIDVLTGDQRTNLYRAFFGKRYQHGELLQVGGQSYGTSSDQDVGGGNELSLFARLGWANKDWSVDGYYMHADRTRDARQPNLRNALARVRDSGAGSRAHRHVPARGARRSRQRRVGAGDGRAFQLPRAFRLHLARGHPRRFRRHHAHEHAVHRHRWSHALGTQVERRRALSQAADRRRERDGSARELRASSARAVALRRATRSRQQLDRRSDGAIDAAAVLRRLRDGRATTRRHGIRRRRRGECPTRGRAQVPSGLVLGGHLAKGAGRRAGTDRVRHERTPTSRRSPPPDRSASIRGKIWRDIGLNVWAVRWNSPGYYRPQLQSHEELYIDTQWLQRFPSKHFRLIAGIAHEYRQDVMFPVVERRRVAVGPERHRHVLQPRARGSHRVPHPRCGDLLQFLLGHVAHPGGAGEGLLPAAAASRVWRSLVLLELTTSLSRHNLHDST